MHFSAKLLGRRIRRQCIWIDIFEIVPSISQAVGIDIDWAALANGPAELLGQSRDHGGFVAFDPRQRGSSDGRQLQGGEDRAGIAGVLVKGTNLDIWRVPELWAVSIQDRVSELVTDNVGAFARVNGFV